MCMFNQVTQIELSSTKPVLGCNDVICGRHKDACNNIGNRRFRILVALMTQKYMHAPTRAHKSMVIRDIVDTVHNCGGRFVHQRKGKGMNMWDELEEKQMFDKVGHAFRDMSVSVKAKSDIRQLLSPSQPAISMNSSRLSPENVSPASNDISIIPTLSYKVSLSSVQDSTVTDEQNNFDDSYRTCDDDNDNWSFDGDYDNFEDLEQCTAPSAVPSTTFFNDVVGFHNKDFDDAGQQWRRDSIKSFQQLVL